MKGVSIRDNEAGGWWDAHADLIWDNADVDMDARH